MSNPIADLSYRNYEGVLQPPTWRWWVIAKMVMKTAIKKKGFWTLAVLSAYWYVLLGVVFYFIDTLGSSSPGGHFLLNQTLSRIVWRDQFLNGFALSQLFLFIIALLIGVGTISNDNRAHALLVYLSKPCTKIDYLAGKWVGIFLVIAAVSAVPTAIFFAYCGLSFSQYGFFSNEPLLWAKLIGIVMLPAAFHASVCLGISSLINQSRLAGAGYAGLYFMSGVFASMMGMVHAAADAQAFGGSHPSMPENVVHLVGVLSYCSVNGLQNGLAKVILDTDGSPLLPGGANIVTPAPNGWLFGAIYLVLCGLSLLIAWSRIRPVEVIGK